MLRDSDLRNSIGMFQYIYDVASNKNRSFDDEKFLRTSAWNIDMELDCKSVALTRIDKTGLELFKKSDITKGKVTPIGLLASQGNHEAVKFLLNVGSSNRHAIKGYKIGGFLSEEENSLDKIFLKTSIPSTTFSKK